MKRVIEGGLVSFPNLNATDADKDNLVYTYSPPLDSHGRWKTKRGDAGSYLAEITVSDGKTTAVQKVQIIVGPLNHPPVIAPIKAITVNEGQTIIIEPKISDLDGDDVQISFSGWKTSFPYKTTFDDQGTHIVTITANDGSSNTTYNIPITVRNVNRAPSIRPLPDVNAIEGDRITVKPTSSDPDNDPLTITYSRPLNSEGKWATKEGDAGTYPLSVTASDGGLIAATKFTITVVKKNLPPEIHRVKDLTVQEGEGLHLDIYATDPENESVKITYSDYMDGPDKAVSYDDGGVHHVTVTATDGVSTAVETFKVTVLDVNRPPVFNPDAFT